MKLGAILFTFIVLSKTALGADGLIDQQYLPSSAFETSQIIAESPHLYAHH